MGDEGRERRRYKRYTTDVEIYFDFVYDLKTKVKFELIGPKGEKVLSKKYSAMSRNVSVGGLCLASQKKVKQGDLLRMEVYLPTAKEPVDMEGLVEWCKPVPVSSDDRLSKGKRIKRLYEVGVQLIYVNGESVHETIHHDDVYDVDWSIVLESIFGNYRMLMEGIFKSQQTD